MVCKNCGENHKRSSGAICGGVGKQYIVRTRWFGCRRYDVVGKPTKSLKVAVGRSYPLAEAAAAHADLEARRTTGSTILIP